VDQGAMMMSSSDKRVVITGMGIICALGDNFEQVYDSMQQGLTGIKPVERFPTERFISRLGAEIADYQPSDHFSVDQQNKYDLCAQYAIVAATKALANCGLNREGFERLGLALGTCNGGIVSLEEQWTISELDETRTARYPFYQQGDHVATHFQLNGPVVTMNTACAASGNAIGYAYDMIRGGYADAMLAGGSDPMSHCVYSGFNVLRALNPEPTSPFSSGYGLSLGEGASFVVLEPLETALSRGATIYGEIRGYGLSNDAFHATAPDPEGKGIQNAVGMALKQAGISASEVGYINAHGTGTNANDQAEVRGLQGVFGDQLTGIPLNSSKGYFGHNLGAAAAIELTTSLYAIRQGFIPATLHFENARVGCENIHIVANEMIKGTPEYMLNNNSAFGGHNASMVVRTQFLDKRVDSIESARLTKKRIGVVGVGSIRGDDVYKGYKKSEIPPKLGMGKERDGACSFSLKDFNKDLYERRMNRLSQFSIGAVQLALEDANWKDKEENNNNIGFIYGTSRGSTESMGHFLNSVFLKGPEFASSIYFPLMVINSISGKIAEKMSLKGFSSSLSTGGNEGIMAALYAFVNIQNGVHERFLISAGDEFSELSDKIDKAKGLDESQFHMMEGSTCLALSDLDAAKFDGLRVYAEISGFGISFGGGSLEDRAVSLTRSILDAVGNAGLVTEQIDGVLLNSVGRHGELERQCQQIDSLFSERDIPIICVNEELGYGESLSSMVHLSTAVEWVASEDVPAHPAFYGKKCDHILTVSYSLNGNSGAAVISRVGRS
jgi:3-oxoacyl-[acyl-carrier-protein] synthase II